MTNFKLIWLVTRRELKERMQARSFLIILAFTVLLSGGAVVAIDVLPGVFEEEPKRLGLTNAVENALELELIESADALGVTVDTRRYGDRSAGEAALQEGEVDALLLGDVNLLFKSKEDTALHAVVDAALYARSLPGRLEELGLTLEDVRPLIEPEGVAVALLDPKDAGEAAASEDRRLVAAVAVMILYLALVLYGERLLNGVIEEKSSRVVEVLLGALRPEHLLAGKVLGIVLVAMTQLFSALIAAGVALAFVGAAQIPSIALDVALISCLFFVLGLLSYSFLYATVGATAARQSEASSAATPLGLVLLVPFFLSLVVIPDNPDSLLARVLSLLPPTAPLAMPTRIATGDPAVIELIASIGLMVPWLLAVIWLAGRLYAGAILGAGPRVGLVAAWRAATETRES